MPAIVWKISVIQACAYHKISKINKWINKWINKYIAFIDYKVKVTS